MLVAAAPPLDGANLPPRPANTPMNHRATPGEASKPQARVLLVDDVPANLLALRSILEESEVILVEARSGDEALQRVREEEFAVILLDVQMHGLDGYETAKRIREQEKSRHTPIIFVTAYESNRLAIVQAYALGAVDYLVKPLVPEILKAKVAAFVDLFQKSEQIKRQADLIRRLERQEFDQAVYEQREWLRVTLASIGDAVITTDTQGRLTFLNSAAQSLTGWTQDGAAGQPLEVVFHIEDEQTRRRIANPADRVLAEGKVIGLGNRTLLIAKDGTERPIEDSAALIRNAGGKVLGIVLVFRDISERKRSEDALRASEARKASMLRASLDGIITIDADGRVVEFNPAAESMFGYREAEVIGQEMAHLVIPLELQDKHRAGLVRYLATGEGPALNRRLQLPARRKDGSEFIAELAITRLAGSERPLFTGFIRDITKERDAEERIYALVNELRDADRRKDEFLAMLAHELRGPLAPLANLLEIMKRGESGDEELRSMMERQLALIVRLVDDLSDLSRITRNRLELRKKRVELASVIHHAVEICRPLSQCAEHEIIVTLPSEPIYLDADPTRLAQVFSNLLNNACKYTEPGGRIEVTAERQGSDVLVKVKDSGIGIPADQLTKIFDMFTQIHPSLDQSRHGLGIGLTLVKQLVELHEGMVEAFSRGPGQGSEFVVRLPFIVEATRLPQSREPKDPAATKRRRILVVDDDRDSAASLAMLLKSAGHETYTAHDGLAAVEVAEKLKPELMFLNIGLPKLNGQEVARRIRAQPWGKEIVLVALTRQAQHEDRRKSKDAGFNHHMVKPVAPAALEKLLAGVR